MARIRSVKPSFFRHEKLQELGPLSMLIFSGLWTQCDKAGRFQWRPRTLKLDILPFLNFDMEYELNKLCDALFIVKYESQGEFFGVIPTFLDHQRISGKESKEAAKFPDPPTGKTKRARKLPKSESGTDWTAEGNQLGSNGEAFEKRLPGQEGSIRNGVQEGSNGYASLPLTPAALSLRVYAFWKKVIKASTRKGDSLKWIQRRGEAIGFERLIMAINLYRLECNRLKTEDKYLKECANFFGEDATFEGFLPDEEFHAKYLPKAQAELNGGADGEKA